MFLTRTSRAQPTTPLECCELFPIWHTRLQGSKFDISPPPLQYKYFKIDSMLRKIGKRAYAILKSIQTIKDSGKSKIPGRLTEGICKSW